MKMQMQKVLVAILSIFALYGIFILIGKIRSGKKLLEPYRRIICIPGYTKESCIAQDWGKWVDGCCQSIYN